MEIANHNQEALLHCAIIDQSQESVHSSTVGKVFLFKIFEGEEQCSCPLRANSRFAAVCQMGTVGIERFAWMVAVISLGCPVLVIQRQACDNGEGVDGYQLAFVHGVNLLFVFRPKPVELTRSYLVEMTQFWLREHIEFLIYQRQCAIDGMTTELAHTEKYQELEREIQELKTYV